MTQLVIVNQLRGSAKIQDAETKRKTGWADTNDRAELMRKAAGHIEGFAASIAIANKQALELSAQVQKLQRALHHYASMTDSPLLADLIATDPTQSISYVARQGLWS